MTKMSGELLNCELPQPNGPASVIQDPSENAFQSAERMQCMEVWGGNRIANSAFEMPGLRVRIYAKPYGDSERGGDVYYLSSCASGRISRMLLADVSGHGSAVAETATSLRQLMRNNINYIDQSRLVRGVNEQFGQYHSDGRFATALIGTYFSPTRSFTLCNAGHPQPLLYRASSNSWKLHEPEKTPSAGIRNLPLGFDGTTEFDSFSTKLLPGDMLLCYTDALPEAPADGGPLGIRGLHDLIREFKSPVPETLIAKLLSRVNEGRSADSSHDDTTVMLLECTDSKVPLRNNLEAPFRLLKSYLQRSQRENIEYME